MPQDIIVATDKPNYLTTGMIAASSSNFDAATPTTTAPSTTSQTFLIPSNLGDKPSLLRLVPFHSVNNATSLGIRVIGWTTYVQTSGIAAYLPTMLADITPAYNTTLARIPQLVANSTTHFFFHEITVATGVPTTNIYTPGTAAAAGTPPAHILIDTIGFQYVTILVKSSTGTMGCFYTML